MGFLAAMKSKEQAVCATVQLNARYQPDDREAYEELTRRKLQANGWGQLGEGGGTMMAPTGEPMECDFDLLIAPGQEDAVTALLDRAFFVPRGSCLVIGDERRPIGHQEGLALYLNGTELPEEVYRTSDINAVIGSLEAHLGEERGQFLSYWQGPEETALYFYGPSFTVMKAALEEILPVHPLCAKCRIIQIA